MDPLPPRPRLTEIVEMLSQSQESLARSQEYLIELAHQIATIKNDNGVEQSTPQPRGSVIAAWRTYPGFRADMIRREREVAPHVEGPVSLLSLANQVGGDSVRSIERQMRKYHLNPRKDWPPSTWPEEEPSASLSIGHQLALVAASVAITIMLDAYNDGRIDGIFHLVIGFCRGQL